MLSTKTLEAAIKALCLLSESSEDSAECLTCINAEIELKEYLRLKELGQIKEIYGKEDD